MPGRRLIGKTEVVAIWIGNFINSLLITVHACRAVRMESDSTNGSNRSRYDCRHASGISVPIR